LVDPLGLNAQLTVAMVCRGKPVVGGVLGGGPFIRLPVLAGQALQTLPPLGYSVGRYPVVFGEAGRQIARPVQKSAYAGILHRVPLARNAVHECHPVDTTGHVKGHKSPGE
jgi:hypothetical protein